MPLTAKSRLAATKTPKKAPKAAIAKDHQQDLMKLIEQHTGRCSRVE
jgi:hypothetical protein